jgi:hypothetical protein
MVNDATLLQPEQSLNEMNDDRKDRNPALLELRSTVVYKVTCGAGNFVKQQCSDTIEYKVTCGAGNFVNTAAHSCYSVYKVTCGAGNFEKQQCSDTIEYKVTC